MMALFNSDNYQFVIHRLIKLYPIISKYCNGLKKQSFFFNSSRYFLNMAPTGQFYIWYTYSNNNNFLKEKKKSIIIKQNKVNE